MAAPRRRQAQKLTMATDPARITTPDLHRIIQEATDGRIAPMDFVLALHSHLP